MPTIKYLKCGNKKICVFLQQRSLSLMTWDSFLGLKLMFSIFHSIQLISIIERKWNSSPLMEFEIRIPSYSTYSSFAPPGPRFFQPGSLPGRLISKAFVNCTPFWLGASSWVQPREGPTRIQRRRERHSRIVSLSWRPQLLGGSLLLLFSYGRAGSIPRCRQPLGAALSLVGSLNLPNLVNISPINLSSIIPFQCAISCWDLIDTADLTIIPAI